MYLVCFIGVIELYPYFWVLIQRGVGLELLTKN